jgi:hypothetical protein
VATRDAYGEAADEGSDVASLSSLEQSSCSDDSSTGLGSEEIENEDDDAAADVAGFFDATPAAAPKLSLCGTAWRLLTQWVSPQSVRYLHGHDEVALPNSAQLVEVRFEGARCLQVNSSFL